MDKPDLKPCPFCGAEALLEAYTGKYQACCDNCSCVHIGQFYNTEKEAVEAWNRRA